jgi:hypothetical protein
MSGTFAVMLGGVGVTFFIFIAIGPTGETRPTLSNAALYLSVLGPNILSTLLLRSDLPNPLDLPRLVTSYSPRICFATSG